MTDININTDFNKFMLKDLKELCKKYNILGYSKKKKDDIIIMLYDVLKKKEMNNGNDANDTNDEIKEINIDEVYEINFDEIKIGEIKQTKYTFIEVCAGGGGLSSGLIKAGFIPLLLNDNNIDCCKTLKKNHNNTNIILGSMEEIDYTKYINNVDLLTGGVPCQSFSQAGLRKGLDDPRGDLMIKFIEIIIKSSHLMVYYLIMKAQEEERLLLQEK